MTTTKTLLASVGLLLGLAGCMGTQNRGVESVHQPVVERNEYAIDLQTARGGLASGEPGRLAGWFDAMRLGYGDRIAVDDPGNAGALARAEVGGVVAGYGLILSDEEPVTAAPVAPGTVRVVVSRARASVPGCPDWSRDASIDFDQHTSSNYGCAANANLAAMAADPADLIRGQSATGVNDPRVVSKAVDVYRKRTPTGVDGFRSEKAGGRQ